MKLIQNYFGICILLFNYRYSTWCYNPMSLFALCILSQNYYLSYRLIQYYGNLEPTLNFLMQVDRFVQLLESPIFVHVRLQLLDETNNYFPYLVKSLYGLLMILPQGNAYTTLKERLNCVTSMHLALGSQSKQPEKIEDVEKYLNQFRKVQNLLKKWRKEHPEIQIPH